MALACSQSLIELRELTAMPLMTCSTPQWHAPHDDTIFENYFLVVRLPQAHTQHVAEATDCTCRDGVTRMGTCDDISECTGYDVRGVSGSPTLSRDRAHQMCGQKLFGECHVFRRTSPLENVLPCQRASTCTRWPAGTLAALPAPNQLTEACQLRVRDCRVGRCDGSLQCPPTSLRF